MESGWAVVLTAALITFVLIKVLSPLAMYTGLLDHPGGRKKHSGSVPLIGGVCIFGGVFVAAYLFAEQPLFLRLFLLAGAMIVFMGVVDDRYELSARFRLVGQFLIACIFVYGLDIRLSSLGNLLGFGEISLGWLGYPLTVLSIIGVVNAVNMLDGMDGLVGSIGLLAFAGLVGLTYSLDSVTAVVSAAFGGALLSFLVFNVFGVNRSFIQRIFLGDAGSMFIGLSVGVLLLNATQAEQRLFCPVTALWFVLLPMTDMFTIMYRRVKRGRSPFSPDRTHIHHILMRAGFSGRQTLYIMAGVQGLLISIGIAFEYTSMPEVVSFASACTLVLAYQLLMKRSWRFIRWSKRRLVAYA